MSVMTVGQVIGVTGGIASGKSLFVSYLAELGAQTISADIISRDLLDTGTISYHMVIEAFGNSILKPDRTIDRSALGEIIFGSKKNRETLNNIIHPQVIELVQKHIENFRVEHASDTACLVVEVPLLFECNMQWLFDTTVVVAAEQDTQLCRLTMSRGMTRTQAIERVDSQLSESVKRELANVVIFNNGSADELRARAYDFFQSICFPLA